MTLPKVLAAHQTVTVDGAEIDIRSLTRAEVTRFQKLVQSGAPLADLEVAVLEAGTDTPADEVRAWYENTPSHVVEAVLSAIKDLSRVDDEARKSG